METFLISAVVLAIFLLGVSVGAILENKIAASKYQLYEVEADIIEIEPYNPIVETNRTISQRRAENFTPVDFELLDPDATLDIPVYDELVKQYSGRTI